MKRFILAFALVCSCNEPISPFAPFDPPVVGVDGHLDLQKSRWAALRISDYDFSLKQWTEWGSGSFDIAVRSGEVVSIRVVEATGAFTMFPAPRLTIDSLFERMSLQVARSEVVVTQARFHPDFHFILFGSWDNPRWADDAGSFRVTGLRSR